MKRKITDIFRLFFALLSLSALFIIFPNADAQTTQASQPSATPTPRQTADSADDLNADADADTRRDDEVIKIETELVNLNVRVVDRNNRSIGNLRRNDFKIYEDNVPQTIEFFQSRKFRPITRW